MNKTREQIEQAMAILEGQRAILGSNVVDASLEALQKQLSTMTGLSTPPMTQQRKQVTLLYTDVVGSTSIARHLDPEDVLEIMDGALKRLAVPVEAQGGHVTRFQGDGFKAVFGTPVAKEDDPERAVRAGLGILETAQVIAAELQAKHSIGGFTVRVGINTGLVMVGGQTEAEDTIMGEAVVLAARMESAAPPGGLLVSHNTYQHITDLFEAQALEPISVKGFDQPVEVYHVLRSRPRPFWKRAYNVAGVATRMVGRDLELGRLQEAFTTCVEENEPQIVSIVGEPGIGKSRLLHEMTAWIELLPQGVTLFRGRPDQDMQQRPYALMRDLFSTRFDIQDSDPLPVAQAKLEQGVNSFGPFPEPSVEARAHFIGQVLGFDFSNSPHLSGLLTQQTALQQIQYRAQVYLRDLFASAAVRRPVALLLEDIHWADDLSLDILNDLLQKLSGKPLFVIATARPALYERRPHWGEGQSYHNRLDLSPLSRRASRKLVEEILQKIENLPEALRELIVGNGEGNPFYLEELVKMMVEDGVIHPGVDSWRVDSTRLTQVRVPSTLAAVLQARFDSLPELERVALQRASVMGRIFWDDALIFLGGSGGCLSCGAALASLRGREMVFQRETSSVRGAQEYLFKHALLREATYESVLKRDRRIYHAAAARWLIERSRDRQAEFAGQIAEHLVRAGQAEEAVQYLRQAGDQAANQFANEQAVQYYTQALDLLSDDALSLRFALILRRTRLYHRMGDLPAELPGVQALEDLSGHLSPVEKIQAAFSKAYACERQGKVKEQNFAARHAVELAQSIGRIDLEAEGLLLIGMSEDEKDQHIKMQVLERALMLARQAGLKYLEPDIYKHQAHMLTEMKNFQAAFEAAKISYEISRELGDLYGEGRGLAVMGNSIAETGDFQAAIEYQRMSQQICHEAGNRYDEGFALMNLWLHYDTLGMFEQLDNMLHEGMEEKTIYIFNYGQAMLLSRISYHYRQKGDLGKAYAYMQRAYDNAMQAPDEIEWAGWKGWGKSCMGVVLVANGREEEGRVCLLEGVQLTRNDNGIVRMVSLANLVRYLATREFRDQLKPYLQELDDDKLLEHDGWQGYISLDAMLACYQGYQLYHDIRADAILDKAHRRIQYYAGRIKDEEMRRSYLENVPHNRELMRLWSESHKL